MGKSITVKAETIEEAIRLAVSILDVELAQVDVEVLANPGSRLFGLRKNVAEVRVSIKRSELDEVDRPEESVVTAPSNDEIGARIINNKIELSFSGAIYPVIEPKKNVRLFVNNEKVKKRIMIEPDDKVSVKVSDELIPPQYSINLIRQGTLAMIFLTPGKKIKRTLLNTEFKQDLIVEANEEIQYYNDLNPQAIVDELKSMGISKGLIFSAIKEATEATGEFEALIAKGVLPTEGLDADLELHVGFQAEEIDSLKKIDYRERNPRVSVRKGQLIATHLPAIAGTAGTDLFGNQVPAQEVNKIVVRTGDNVSVKGYDIFANVSGTLSVEWHGKLVEIDVNTEFVYDGEVNMKSGNIRFKGDLTINGDIRPSMFVSASGDILISGAISKATVVAEKSIIISGNVFSSTVSVGKSNLIVEELVVQLYRLLGYLEQIDQAIDHLLHVRGETAGQMDLSELMEVTKLIYRKRYGVLQKLCKEFVQKVKNHSTSLQREWVEISEKLYGVLLTQQSVDVKNAADFTKLVEETRSLHMMYATEMESLSYLSLPYAINSELYCKGDIVVKSRGLFHSFVTAGHSISVSGVCRGGELFAENQVILHESGSKNMVKTVVRTSATGSIRIGYAYAGTEIYVGLKQYILKNDKSNVYVRLDENAELYMG